MPRIGSKKLTALSVRDVRLMVDDLRAAGMSPRMVQWVHATLRAALEHAFREELVTRNVASACAIATPAKVTNTEPFSSTRPAFLRAVEGHRLDALWVTMLMLGLRRSEVCGLHWDDVDFDAGTLAISAACSAPRAGCRSCRPRPGGRRRTVPLPRSSSTRCPSTGTGRQGAAPSPAGCAGRTPPYVFTSSVGTPLEPRTSDPHVRTRSGGHGFRRVRLHDLRHTCVSLLLSLGVHPRIVMEIVGHWPSR